MPHDAASAQPFFWGRQPGRIPVVIPAPDTGTRGQVWGSSASRQGPHSRPLRFGAEVLPNQRQKLANQRRVFAITVVHQSDIQVHVRIEQLHGFQVTSADVPRGGGLRKDRAEGHHPRGCEGGGVQLRQGGCEGDGEACGVTSIVRIRNVNPA